MAPSAPASAVAARALTLDARQGDARALGRVDVKGRLGRALLAEVESYTINSIDHVDVAIYEYAENEVNPENSLETYKDKVEVASADLDKTLTFVGLRAETTYRVRATAYASPGSGRPISVPEGSFVTFKVYSNDRPAVAVVPVQLKNVPFNARATAEGFDVQEGGYDTGGTPFITPGGVLDPEAVTTRAGNTENRGFGHVDAESAGSVRFSNPQDVATIGLAAYVADTGNRVIRRLEPSGATTTVAGTSGGSPGLIDGTPAVATFLQPLAIEADGDGNLWVADSYLPAPAKSAIRKISPTGQVTTVAGGDIGFAEGVGTAARFMGIEGLAWDRGRGLYVSDNVNRLIRKLDFDTDEVTIVAGQPYVYGGADGPAGAASFRSATGLALDLDGNLLVCDRGAHTIRKITFGSANGPVVSTIAGLFDTAGADDGVGTAARFNLPNRIAVDGLGNAYVTEWGSNRVRKLTFGANGVATVTTFAGYTAGYAESSPVFAGAARFYGPAGMAIDHAGRLLLADSNNNLIRAIGFASDNGSP
jgi:sugar lactone lactonase YvrE